MKGTVIAQSLRATVWNAGVGFPAGARYSSFLHIFQTYTGANPATYPLGRVSGELSQGIKWHVHEVDHSSPSPDRF
jgi:hypothetical protein